MPDDVRTQIETNATSPKRVTVDGQTVEMPSISESIEADRYLSAKAAQSNKYPLRMRRVRRPGTAP